MTFAARSRSSTIVRKYREGGLGNVDGMRSSLETLDAVFSRQGGESVKALCMGKGIVQEIETGGEVNPCVTCGVRGKVRFARGTLRGSHFELAGTGVVLNICDV
jgi:hypothetical protein